MKRRDMVKILQHWLVYELDYHKLSRDNAESLLAHIEEAVDSRAYNSENLFEWEPEDET